MMKYNRMYGIDLIRILSMMMVLVLHIFSNGGALNYLIPGTINYYVGWLVEAMCFCAVDIFAIMTGYLMVNRKTEYWKFIPRWLQAWTISVMVTITYNVFAGGGRVTAKEWLITLFPLTFSQWKYLTEYFIVVLFMPYINLAIKHMSELQHKTVFGMIVGFSFWTTLSFSDPINLKAGYSVIWIVLLYILGALIKTLGIDKKISSNSALLGYFVCVILAYGSKVIEVFLDGRLTRVTKGTGVLMSYVSPAVLFCAIFLLVYFSKIQKIPGRILPGIRWMSKVSFGVFLIHTQIIIRTRLYTNAFVWITSLPLPCFIGVIVGSTVVIYLLCGILEDIRQRLFACLDVNRRANKMYSFAKAKFLKIIDVWAKI